MRHTRSANGTVVLLALVITIMGVAHAAEQTAPPRAALLKAGLPGEGPELIEAVTKAVGNAGFTVETIDAAALCDPARLKADKYRVLVLPNAACLPINAAPVIDGYLKQGGDIIALRAPLWQQRMMQVGGVWKDYDGSRDEYERNGAARLPEHILYAFDNPDSIAKWKVNSEKAQSRAAYSITDEGPVSGRQALHAVIPDLASWDTFGPQSVESPFPVGHTLTVFAAKGGTKTTELSLEWTEKDGSRWIATVPLSRDWRLYVLEPRDFKFWESVPARSGDVFHPENAVSMSIGLALTHTRVEGKAHEYWVGPFGTARASQEFKPFPKPPAIPVLDTLSPSYKLFDATGVAALSYKRFFGTRAVVLNTDSGVAVSDIRIALPPAQMIQAPHPRPQGAGFNKGIVWRWIPVVEATTNDKQWRGNPVTLLVHAAGPYKGGVWASFGVNDGDWYLKPQSLSLLERVAARMKRGVFIIEGGADNYTYFDGQKINYGVRVVNFGAVAQGPLAARLYLTNNIPDNKTVRESQLKEFILDLAPGEEKTVSGTLDAPTWPEKGYRIDTELLEKDEVIDFTSHEINVWRPKQEKRFMTVKDGDFMLDGKRWRAHGVNYMPTSGIGIEDNEYFELWLGARSYDPDVIQRDLENIKSLGMNSVSIFIYRKSMEAQNLLDMLRRLDALGMKANLSLRPGTPMEFLWDQMRELIQYYRIADNDTVFAYDLAWEPSFDTPPVRHQYDAQWRDWIVERYGSIENAEKDWAFAAPRDAAGKVIGPDAKQLTEDGDWRRMIAAYRRFLDTLLYDKYGAARRLVRSIDPNHLVSFRMTDAGDPTYKWNVRVPYDFPYLASAVDLLEPEAYDRIGDWEKVKPGWFQFEYARWAAPAKPMIWAEMGTSAWAMTQMKSPESLLQAQADFYTHFYRMLISSAADGIFFWWYPGGFRFGENSDYGIINPDGSDRAVTKVIRSNAKVFLEGPSAKPIDHWIETDRDLYPVGVAGIYDAAQKEFWQAIADGKTPGLKTAGTGTDSSNCPLVAVGNTPCNGNNPPKYLDGFFDVVEIKNDKGEWMSVEKGATVKVNPDADILARVTLTNLGEAKWLSSKSTSGPGAVSVVADGVASSRASLPDVAHGETITVDGISLAPKGLKGSTTVALSLSVAGRGPAKDGTPFGPRFQVTLTP